MNDTLETYFSGERLYGDDFTLDQIESWYEDEAEGYAGLQSDCSASYQYKYHQLNQLHGYRHLGGRKFGSVLGFGSAYGEELRPVISRINRITVYDPSETFANVENLQGVPVEHVKPEASGKMPFQNGEYDLITCFGVMHHIPNVSYVLKECARCLADEGVMLLREPINSMGDWRQPRPGLTKHERGIPVEIMDDIVKAAGLQVRARALCNFPLLPRLADKLGIAAYNSRILTVTDYLLSGLFAWNVKYHRVRTYEKFAPASVFYVLSV